MAFSKSSLIMCIELDSFPAVKIIIISFLGFPDLFGFAFLINLNFSKHDFSMVFHGKNADKTIWLVLLQNGDTIAVTML